MAHKHQNTCPIPDDLCSAYREQLRIIKLLEVEGINQQTGLDSPEWHLGEIIALIKGEDK